MKRQGSKIEYGAERDAALLRAYRQELRTSARVNIDEISARIALYPCSRFWVSEERATIVISAMLRGEASTQRMLPTKKRMFDEILRRVLALRAQCPRSSLYALVSEVVNQSAPEFYLSARYVRDRVQCIVHSA